MDEDTLIQQYIEENPERPGPADARLVDSCVPVWALVGYYLEAVNQDLDRVAVDYEVPRPAVEAALAYYHRHKPIIHARIAANVA